MGREQQVWARYTHSFTSSLKVFGHLYAELDCTIVDGPAKMVDRDVRVLLTAEEARKLAQRLLIAAETVERHMAEDADWTREAK